MDEHVALFILSAELISNVALNAKVEDSHVVDAVLVDIKATQKRKSTPSVDFVLNGMELLGEPGQGKVRRVDLVTIKAESYCNQISQRSATEEGKCTYS